MEKRASAREEVRRAIPCLLERIEEPDRFSSELRGLLFSLGSPEGAAGAARFIPGLAESFGVPVPVLSVIAGELWRWGKARSGEAIALVERLWRSGTRDERVVAAKLLERLGKLDPERTLDVASSFVGDLRNWEECDQLACFGLRNVVQAWPDLVLPRCKVWVKSPDKWARRFAVAVLTSLPKDEGYRPSEREFDLLDQVLFDPAREVQDAVAWALREIGKRHPEAVAGYLHRHARSANRYTRRIVRLALKGLPEAERASVERTLEGE